MKNKLLFTILLSASTISTFAQEWKKTQNKDGLYLEDKNHGVNAKTGIGLINPAYPLDVKGTFKLRGDENIDSTLNIGGKIIFNGISGTMKNTIWAGNGVRLLQTDANGNILPFAISTSAYYLSGDMQWTKFPDPPPALWEYDINGYLAPINTNTSVSLLGGLKLDFLAGNGISLLQVGNSGKVSAFPMGAANQVLNGLGQWITVSGSLWQNNGNDVYWTAGNVGIGTNAPAYKLDVDGDVFIHNNLYVGGAILITDKVKATSEVKTAKMSADTLMMDSTKMIGKTDMETATVKDSIIVGQKMAAGSSATAIAVNNAKIKLSVNGAAEVSGSFTAKQIEVGDVNVAGDLRVATLGGNNGGPVYADNNGTFNGHPTTGVGDITDGNVESGGATSCDGNYDKFVWENGGNTSAYCLRSIGNKDNFGFTMITNNTTRMSIGTNGDIGFKNKTTIKNDGKIGIGTSTPFDKLDIAESNYHLILSSKLAAGSYNYLTKANDMGIFFSDLGGSAGQNASSGFVLAPLKNSNAGLRMDADGNVEYKGVQHFVEDIFSDSKVYLGSSQYTNFVNGGDLGNTSYNNALLHVNGGIVAQRVLVTNDSWADFVFDKNYNLMSLKEIEAFIIKNHHLPEVPSESEIKNNGADLFELSKIQMKKIEELTLFIIEQNKRMELMEAKLKLISDLK